MKFQRSKDGISLSVNLIVLATDNVVSIRQQIAIALWENEVNVKNISLYYNNNSIDKNQYLLEVVGSQDAIIDCDVDFYDVNSMIILNTSLMNEEPTRRSIQMERNQMVLDLKQIISYLYNLDGFDIMKGNDKLISGTINDYNLVDNDTLSIIVSDTLLLYPILSTGEPYHIPFSNEESVADLKQRVSVVINQSVDDFVLIFNHDILEETLSVASYGIMNGSSIQFCYYGGIDGDEATLTDRIGTGAFSEVYRQRGDGGGAIKKYEIIGQSQNVYTYKPLIRELIAFYRIDKHPRIVRLNKFYRDAQAFYIDMEYMAGGSLHEYIRQNGPLHEQQIATWTRQIVEGLEYLHRERIIHRDLKTSNILLDGMGNVKISGLSLSKFLMGANSTALSQGLVNSKAGTYNYMAPEIFNDEKSGWKADIWSLGAILVEMVTGHAPYHDMNEVDAAIEIATTGTIEYDAPGISQKLRDFISCCLKSNPRERLRAGNLLLHEFLDARPAGIAMEEQ